jgi:hypothetical protein
MKTLLKTLPFVALFALGCTSAQQAKEQQIYSVVTKAECLLAAGQSTVVSLKELCPGNAVAVASCPALGQLLADLQAKVEKCNAQ